MTDSDIPNKLIYDEVRLLRADVTSTREELAKIGPQLAQGAETFRDHEDRIRSLESAREQGTGRSSLLSHLLTLAGSGAVATVVSYLLTRGR